MEFHPLTPTQKATTRQTTTWAHDDWVRNDGKREREVIISCRCCCRRRRRRQQQPNRKGELTLSLSAVAVTAAGCVSLKAAGFALQAGFAHAQSRRCVWCSCKQRVQKRKRTKPREISLCPNSNEPYSHNKL